MALAGIPQYMIPRAFLWSGSGATEVDMIGMNGQDKFGGTTPFSEPNVTHTVTAGPLTAGPIIVEWNNVLWAFNFNQAVAMPDGVWQQMQLTTQTNATGQWTWA